MADASTGTAILLARLLRLAVEVSLWTVVPLLIVLVLAGLGAWSIRSAQGDIALAAAATAGALVVIAVVALLNLFVALPRGPGLAVVPVGLVALWISARRLHIDRTVLLRVLPWAMVTTALYRVGRQALDYDAFLYHGAILEWLEREPTPQGFALLHSRFAFNPALTLLMAPFRSTGSDWSHHVLLEIAVVVLAAVTMAATIHRARLAGDGPLLGLLLALVTLCGAFLMFRDVRVGMDLAAGMTFLAAFAVGATSVRPGVWRGRDEVSGAFVLLGLLIAFAVVQKTSSIASVLLLTAPFVAPQTRGRVALRPVLPALALAGVAGALVALRTWVMSGCLSYPVAITCIDAPWTPGKEAAGWESATILSWARSGTMEHLTLSDLSWVGRWYSNLEWSMGFRVAALAVLIGLAVRAARALIAGRGAAPLPRLLWSTAAVAIGFWLVSAPDPRFGFPGLLAVGALVLAPAFTIAPDGMPAKSAAAHRSVPVVASTGAALVVIAATLLGGGRYFPFSGSVPHDFASGTIRGVDGTPDLVYRYPVGSDQCGDAFPCAPAPRGLVVERPEQRLLFRRDVPLLEGDG